MLMKAITISTYGGPEVLQYKDVEIPTIKSDEILVRTHSAGVSPFDLHVRDGWYKESNYYTLPIILGWEISGVVAETGKDITKFKKGDEVFGYINGIRNGGAYAEYTVVKENEVVHKPKSITHHQAAAASMNALTAWQAMFDIANLSAGQTILIHAATGGIGHLAVQLAKWKGAYVIGTASARNKAFLLDLGADEVIDYTTTPFEKIAKNIDVVLDNIGGDTLLKSFSTLKKSGVVVTTIDFEGIKAAEKFGVRGETVFVNPNPQQLTAIAELLDKKILKPNIEKTFPLIDAAKAQLHVQSGRTRGKVTLEI